MIPKTEAEQGVAGAEPNGSAWRRELAAAITEPAELLRLLELPKELLGSARAASGLFALRVPRGFVAKMRPGDPADPLLLQVLPLGAELTETPGFSADPVGDLHAAARPGVLHKYRGRALLMVAGGCAVNCRYCFRREFPYAEHRLGGAALADALAYLAADPSIEEVILSGGDPLLAGDERLGELVRGLVAIPHLQRLRVHTRLPVVLPERITEELLSWMAGTRLRPVMVIHANHPRELGADVVAALTRLRTAGVTLLNQSVLLAGVNDSASTQAELSTTLFEAGVLPYYLHLLDRVRGAAHFEVPEEEGRQLLRVLTQRLPGYLVPRLVREKAGAGAKVPVDLRID